MQIFEENIILNTIKEFSSLYHNYFVNIASKFRDKIGNVDS